ncbi:hypothetical protein Poli38472_002067 [Pythium oligandrum]|uniref:Protein phosphatase 1 regulatory subunit 11 n=1 Tax=Pythium oligandrum TaxID=41045 RepID=A0A8K1CGJ8_PYTOL|nr:hypothetical protein Poli38472_002067 [Pythium oligandrum]|eukprot:TMW63126.1 hypothetical protein Poli38472_002067 [Pythium oligandrum]
MEARADPMTATTVVTTPAATEEAPTYRVQLRPRPRVTFDEDVVDNEHLGRKKSNKCCIFHKKRAFGESSSESGEDSEREHRKPHSKDCEHRKRKPVSQRPNKPQPFVPSQDA